MEIEVKKGIIQALEQYMTEHSLSQNDVIKRSGVNSAYIIAMRNGDSAVEVSGKQTEISDRYYKMIAEMIGYQIEKSYWKIQPTVQLMEAMPVLIDALKYGYTNILIGGTGCGKTTSLNLFKEKNPNDVHIITVSQLDNIGDLLDKVIDSLSIVPAKTKSKKLRDITKKLRELKMKGVNTMLAFDECEYMKQPALCAMKELHDNLNKYCSIVMAGHQQFLTNIEKLRKKDKDGIPQFWRRVKFGVRHLSNIDRRYELFLSDIQDRKLIKFLRENCENYGELHDVLVPAMREADRTGELLSENFIRKILNMPEVA